MHGIVHVGATLAVAPNNAVVSNANASSNAFALDDGARVNRAPTVDDIVGAYKSLVANECLKLFKLKYPNRMMGKLWQRNYYEHIIRDENSCNRIREYIINNPAQWDADKFNPTNKKKS